MTIQSITFNKKYWDKGYSKLWLEANKIKPIKKAHVTKNFIRYRITSPNKYKRFITKKISKGINIIIGFK